MSGTGLAQVTLELGSELAAQLRRLARAQGESAEEVAVGLLHLGLQHERRRRLAEDVLDSLTPRQREVARLAAGGRTNRQIARELWLSPETVKTHLRRALERFDLHSKSDLRLLLIGLDGDRAAHPGGEGASPPEETPSEAVRDGPAEREARLPED